MKNMCNPYNQKLWGKLQNYKYMARSYVYDLIFIFNYAYNWKLFQIILYNQKL